MEVSFSGGGAAIDPTEILWHHRNGLDYRCRRKLDGTLVFKPIIRGLKDLVVFASGKSNDWITKILNGLWSHSAAVTFPATLYFALWTAALTAASTGATAGECSYTGYTRVAVTPNTTNFSTSSGGSAVTNSTAITWGANTGSLNTATFAAVLDLATIGSGNIVMWGSITSTAINPGDTPQINTGALTATEA